MNLLNERFKRWKSLRKAKRRKRQVNRIRYWRQMEKRMIALKQKADEIGDSQTASRCSKNAIRCRALAVVASNILTTGQP